MNYPRMLSRAIDRTLVDMETSGDPHARARALERMAGIEASKGGKVEACRLYLEALALYRSKRRHDSPLCGAGVACSLYSLGYREQAREILNGMGDPDLREIMYADLARDTSEAGKTGEAIELLTEVGDLELKAEAAAEVCRKFSAGDEKAREFLAALESEAEAREPGPQISVLCYLAKAYQRLGDRERMRTIMVRARALLEDIPGLARSWQAADGLVKAHLKLGLVDEAKGLVTGLLGRMVEAKLIMEEEAGNEKGIMRGVLYSSFVRVASMLAGTGEDVLVEGMITFLEGEEHKNIGRLYIGEEYAKAGYLERAQDMAFELSGVHLAILETRIAARLITEGRGVEAKNVLHRAIRTAIEKKSWVVLREAALELYRLNPGGRSARNLMSKAQQLAKRQRKPGYDAYFWSRHFGQIGDFPRALILAYKVPDLERRLDILEELMEMAGEMKPGRTPRMLGENKLTNKC